MKKILKSFVIAIAILFLLSSTCFGATDLKNQIDKEDGSLFEKIIAGCIRWNCTNCARFYYF